MANPTFVYDATTLTFRPGCIQSTIDIRVPRQSRRRSTGGGVMIRERSNVVGHFLRVQLQQLHEDDEGSFAGWTSLETFLKTTVNYATTEFVYTDADGDEYNVRLWGRRLSVHEARQGVWEGELLLRVRDSLGEQLLAYDYFDAEVGVDTSLVAWTGAVGISGYEHTGSDPSKFLVRGTGSEVWFTDTMVCSDSNHRWIRFLSELPTDNCRFKGTFYRGTQGANNSIFGGLMLYHPNPGLVAIGSTVGEGLIILYVNSTGTTAALQYYEVDSGGSVLQSGNLATGLSFTTGGVGRHMELRVSGLDVTVFDRLASETDDDLVERGTVNLITDFRDGNHNHHGIRVTRGSTGAAEIACADWEFYGVA